MNIAAVKMALANSKHHYIRARVSFFHSSPVLSRRGRNFHPSSKRSHYSKRHRRNYERESMLHSINSYTEFLFKNWREHHGFDEDDPCMKRGSSWSDDSTNNVRRDGSGTRDSWRHFRSGENRSYYWSSEDEDEDDDQDEDEDEEDDTSSSRGPSWFRREFSANKFRKNRKKRSRSWGRNGYEFCYDIDDEVDNEPSYRSGFHGDGFYHFSFINGENRQQRSSRGNSGRSWSWEDSYKEEYGSESDNDGSSESELALDNTSDRLALGLSVYGPLKLKDVKTAYRSCALQWHPDRHQGTSKVEAEAKFKLCSAAYQSLCDKLEVN